VSGGDTVTATFTVTNTGKIAGADVPQVYLTDAAGARRMRLLGFARVDLAPGAPQTVTVTADPRLLATFDGKAGQWQIVAGTYRVALGKSASISCRRPMCHCWRAHSENERSSHPGNLVPVSTLPY